MSEEMKSEFTECLAEGYDLDDPLYVTWRVLETTVTVSEHFSNDSPFSFQSHFRIQFTLHQFCIQGGLTLLKPVEKRKRVAAKFPVM